LRAEIGLIEGQDGSRSRSNGCVGSGCPAVSVRAETPEHGNVCETGETRRGITPVVGPAYLRTAGGEAREERCVVVGDAALGARGSATG
jgi:hypothetical protein